VLAAGALYAPVAQLELVKDDYEWMHLAHRAMLEPKLMLAPLGGFFRPTATWSLAFERLLWGADAGRHHVATLGYHLSAGVLLLLVGARLGLRPLIATVVSLVWTCSIFAHENAVSVVVRHQTFLMWGWLLLIYLWPATGDRWTTRRRIAIGMALALCLLSKESWVVTPAIVVALELALRGWRWRPALVAGGWLTLAVVVFIGFRFALVPGLRGYFEFSPTVLVKSAHLFGAFVHFEPIQAGGFVLTWANSLATVLILGLAAAAWRWRLGAGVVGTALLVAPLLPTLFVPYLPLRYTSIPYAGLLVLIAAWVEWLLGRKQMVTRWLVGGASICVAVLVWVVHANLVVAELDDWQRISDAHRRLLDEARSIASALPVNEPVLVIRGERYFPLTDVIERPSGLPKSYFVRGDVPYGLVEPASLFDWVMASESHLVVDATGNVDQKLDSPGRTLVHRHGGFEWGATVEDVGIAVAQQRSLGHGVRVIVVEPQI